VVFNTDKGGKDLEEDGGVNLVDPFPGGVENSFRPRGRSGRALGEGYRYLLVCQGVRLLIRSQAGRRGKGFLRGEEVVQQDLVHLFGGLCPRKGWKAGWGAAVGDPLGPPNALGAGAQQEGRPLCVFGGLDRLELPRFANVGHVWHSWGPLFPSCSGGFMQLTAEGCQLGRPPRFGVMRGSGDWCVFLQKGSESV